MDIIIIKIGPKAVGQDEKLGKSRMEGEMRALR